MGYVLTSVEQALVKHVERGGLLDLIGDGSTDEHAMRSWGATQTIRADVIREILRGRLACDADPHGLWLRGARIVGRLDFFGVSSSIPIRLIECFLGDGLDARDAVLRRIDLARCWIEHASEPALAADRLQGTTLRLTDSTVVGRNRDGAVRLDGANFTGELNFSGTTLRNDNGPALHAHGFYVEQTVSFTRGFTAFGGIRLIGARINGQLTCKGATLSNESGPALHADGINVQRSVFLNEGFTATGSGPKGAV